mgnify:CR=1 FL=1
MKRNVLGILLAGAIGAALITGCGAASSGTARSSAPQQTQESAPEDGDAGKSAADTPDLTVPDYNLGRRRHVHSRFSRGAETS